MWLFHDRGTILTQRVNWGIFSLFCITELVSTFPIKTWWGRGEIVEKENEKPFSYVQDYDKVRTKSITWKKKNKVLRSTLKVSCFILNKKLLLLFLLKPSSMKEISPRFESTGSTKFKTVKADKNVHTSSFSWMVYNQGFMDSDLGHFSRNCQFCNTADNW